MSPDIQRGPHLLPALLHATHALSIPVNLGIEYVSRSQAFVWSIQHALCGLEFAVLVNKWLKCTGHSMEKLPLKGTVSASSFTPTVAGPIQTMSNESWPRARTTAS
jgi:hypothetical protein